MIKPRRYGEGNLEGGHSKSAEDGVTRKLQVVEAHCSNSKGGERYSHQSMWLGLDKHLQHLTRNGPGYSIRTGLEYQIKRSREECKILEIHSLTLLHLSHLHSPGHYPNSNCQNLLSSSKPM